MFHARHTRYWRLKMPGGQQSWRPSSGGAQGHLTRRGGLPIRSIKGLATGLVGASDGLGGRWGCARLALPGARALGPLQPPGVDRRVSGCPPIGLLQTTSCGAAHFPKNPESALDPPEEKVRCQFLSLHQLTRAAYSPRVFVSVQPHSGSYFPFESRTPLGSALVILQRAHLSPKLCTPRIQYGPRNSNVWKGL